ncbi:MAG: Fic family protein [Armatimonadetes bacterium]|nr:Fic family protein [Armatimonadota bacterium]
MERGASGRRVVVSTVGEEVGAFVPAVLPPVPPVDLSGPRLRLLEQAQLACGRLDGLARLLPDPSLFLYAYVRREAVLSSQIEGTQSSLSDLLLFELDEAPGVPLDDVVEVSNYVDALSHGLTRMGEGFPLSRRLLCEVHARLLARGRGADKQPGEFRRSQNWIGGTRPGNAAFVPPPPGEIARCMADLERFIHDETKALPVLVKAALAHVQFETIHPFLDGNGRVGRLLISLMLANEGLLAQPLLYLSLYFKQHRPRYYELLDSVRRAGDWEAWLDFFLDGVTETAGSAVDTAHSLLAVFRRDEDVVNAASRALPSLPSVYAALRARPVANVADLANRAQVSFPAAGRAVERLVEAGIARELTGGRRNRVFAYTAYVAILSAGTEPL